MWQGFTIALREGIALYNDGDYNGAIRRLSSADMKSGNPRERLSAAKYTAFSYCVSGRQALCRETFDAAVDRYRQAQQVHERCADDWNAAIASANIAEILLDQGRLDDAEPLAAEALRVWRATTPSDIGFGAALMGRICARRGRFDEAFALLEEAKLAYAAMDESVELVAVELAVAEALYAAVAEVLAYVFQLRAFNQGGGKYPDRPTKLAVPPELDPHNPASQKKPDSNNGATP